MIILNRGSLTQTGRFAPETMALNLSERQSTATMTMAIDAAELAVGDWLQDDTEPGAGIVWRVKTIDRQYNTNTMTVQLEHMINSLADQLLNGQITPAMMGGLGASTCTARQAIEYVLNRQTIWELDDFDYDDVSNPYNFNGDSLKAAIETVSSSLTDPVWSYDFSTFPFKISITQLSDDVASEMRMNRNISTMRATVDRTRMYTRFYPIGKNNLRLPDPGYVSMNESTWGVVEKTETDQSLDTAEKLTAWANEKLNVHAHPIVTVTIAGLELSDATGEDLDHLVIGTKCRVPLPDYYTTVTETITKLSWKDKISEPENVTVTLANAQEDVASIVNNLIKGGGGGGRAAAQNAEEDHAWFVDTASHVGMIAEAVAGEGAATDWSIIASVMVDGNGVHQRVQQAEGDIITAFSAIEETSTQIFIAVGNAKSDLYSYIDVTAEGIQIAAAAASSTMYSVIEQTATYINSEVSRKARVYVQPTNPQFTPGITLMKGDIWVKSVNIQSWNDMGGKTWTAANEFDWNQYAGPPQYVWDGSRWERIGDSGAFEEYKTKIIQNDQHIQLLAQAVNAIDPTAIAQASLDVSAEAITAAVSTAKSELYSVIRQTATNITSEVVDDINGVSSYVEQTASSLNQAIARKNRVFVQPTDPANDTTIKDGDIWIKSVGADNLRPTWSELSAKTWTSQNTTNWREYYEGYWYTWKNGAWHLMSPQADVVEIGTMLEWDEKHLAMVARTVDENHIEMGSRLEVTAQYIRGEVHAAKSTLYSVIEQTATQIRSEVTNVTDGLSSTITQQADKIALVVTQKDGQDVVDAASIVAGINNQTGSYVKIKAKTINLDGYVQATDITTDYLAAKIAGISSITMNSAYATGLTVGGSDITLPSGLKLSANGVWQLSISQSGDTYTLTEQKLNGSTRQVGTFSRATTLSGAWSGGIYKVTASPQGNTNSSGMISNGTVSRSGNYIDIRVNAGNVYTGKTLTINWKDYLTSHSNCVAGLTRRGTSKITLYSKVGDNYYSAGEHYWYYKDSNSALTTYYS